jgi:small subunit ribosomal protein S8
MSLSDPIADMLTRIRNAQGAGREMVEMPSSKMKTEIVRILKREGYVRDFSIEGGEKKTLRIYLKYTEEGVPAIKGLKRESRPGLRNYTSQKEMPKVLGGLGVMIVSTSKGILTDRDARKQNIGGEVLCSIW